VTLDSFEIIGLLGDGAYGHVYMARKFSSGKYYALKAISKRKLM